MKQNEINDLAVQLYKDLRTRQLKQFQSSMPDGKKGHSIKINGKEYICAIRRLTPNECNRLQTIPEWYDWTNISDTQQYKMLGNGWTVDVIKHCFSLLPQFDRPIRVWSLFDGMSCGRVALKELNIQVESYISSEIDKFAILAEKNNFPDIAQVGSVTDIDVDELVKEYGAPDLLCGGSPCFVAGTKVLTKDGYKNIEDVSVGDEVLTHKNRYKKVLRTGKRWAHTIKIETQGFLDVCCTEEHPFLARKKTFECHKTNSGNSCHRIGLDKPQWISARRLPQTYFVANNIEQESCDSLGLDKEELWLLGYFLVRGTYVNDGLNHLSARIRFYKEEELNSHLTENCQIKTTKRGYHTLLDVITYGKLGEAISNFKEYFSRCIPEEVIRLPKLMLKSVADGIRASIGTDMKNDMVRLTVKTEEMQMAIQRVMAKAYGIGVRVYGEHVNWVDYYTKPEKGHSKLVGDKIWYGVKNKKDNGERTVYNLEVEDDNSYTANNIVVHNCQSFSFSGKMKGMSTKSGEEIYTLEHYLELKEKGFQFEGQSYLFWEYMRILTELRKYNPKLFFFLENVEMLEKWERCLSHAIGVRGVHINSALVSAQNRRRIYWSNIRTKEIPDTRLFPEFEDNDPFSWPMVVTDIPQPKDQGLVIKDVLENDVDSKYYLSDETTGQLMSKTDLGKLKEYLLTPQVSKDEAIKELQENSKYNNLTDEERFAVAEIGYNIEKKRLYSQYYGKEGDIFDGNTF